MSTIESNKKDFSAKGTISNPYTEEEYQQLQAEGKDIACYVEGRGFCAPAAMAPPTNPGSPSDSSDSSNSETDPTDSCYTRIERIQHGDYVFSCAWYAKVKGVRQPDGYISLSELTIDITPSGIPTTKDEQDDEGNCIKVNFIAGGAREAITRYDLMSDFPVPIEANLDCHEVKLVGDNSTTKLVTMVTSITLVPKISSNQLSLSIFGTPTATIQNE